MGTCMESRGYGYVYLKGATYCVPETNIYCKPDGGLQVILLLSASKYVRCVSNMPKPEEFVPTRSERASASKKKRNPSPCAKLSKTSTSYCSDGSEIF